MIEVTKVKDIPKDEIKKAATNLTFESLEKQAKTVFNRVNKRIRNLSSNRKNVISPALNALEKKRGASPRFGTSGSYTKGDMGSLQKELALALEFDNMETSTVKGATNYTNNLKRQLGGTKLNNDAINIVFDSLHALHERMPDTIYGNLLQYKDYLDTIVETQENIDFDNLDENALNEIVETAINNLTDKISGALDEVDYLETVNYNRLF